MMSARSFPGRVTSPTWETVTPVDDLNVTSPSDPVKHAKSGEAFMFIPARTGITGLAGMPLAALVIASARLLRSPVNSISHLEKKNMRFDNDGELCYSIMSCGSDIPGVFLVDEVENLPALVTPDGGVRAAVIAPHLRVFPHMRAQHHITR